MKKKIIKIIAVILMAAFIAQDIVLAFPNIRQNAPSQSSLQIPSMFQDIRFDRYASMLEARLKYVLAAIPCSKDFKYRLTLPMGAEGIKVDLNFDRQYPEGENTVLPCALYTPTSSRLYEAVITPDGSIQLRDAAKQALTTTGPKDILNELSRRITTYQQHSKSAQQSGRPDSVKNNLSGIDFPGSLGDGAGFYDPAYVVSSESYRDIARKLHGLIKKQNIEKGRVYLGVSFEQNLSFIAAVDPEMAIILDNNRYVTEVAFPMIMALIRESTDLEDMKKRLPALKNLQEADNLIMKVLPSGSHQIMAKEVWRDKGPQWVEQWLSYWQKEGAWLRSKEDFDVVKRLVQDNKIKTISGDWNGETPKYLAGYLKGIGKEINVLYLSNIVPSDMHQNFLDGVENLPKSDNCVVIHGLGGYVEPVVQPYNTSILKIVHKLQQKEKEFPVIYLASGLYWLGLEAGGGLFSQKRIAEAVEPIGYILKTYKDTHPHWPELIKEILATQIKTAEDKDAQRVYQEALGRLIDLRLLPPEDIVQARGEQQLAVSARKPTSSPKSRKLIGGSMEGQNAPTLCLTPDSLIYLAGGAAKPLIEIREGDMVLSLNEKVQTLEPHRVNALLDMGVKPVYRITTAGGRTLKTTLTHPYLTKNGWRKLKDIRVGEEVAVAEEEALASVSSAANLNTFNKHSLPRNIKRNTIFADAKTVGTGRKVNQRLGADKRIFQRSVISQFFINTFLNFFRQAFKFFRAARRKLDGIHKEAYANPSSCLISLKGTQPFFFASAIDFLRERTKSGLRGSLDSILSISQPAGFTDLSWYSSVDNLSMRASSILESTSRSAGVSKIKIWGVPFLSTMTAAFEPLLSLNTEAGVSLLNGMSFANFSFSGNNFICKKSNIRIPVLSSLSWFLSEAEAAENTFTSPSSGIRWDKIISIDYLVSLPVYDIEVEGTHNFIAQGIVAHNTYVTGSNQKTEETAGLPLKEDIDRRPVETGLLDEAYVCYDMAVKRVVNSHDEPKVAIYGGAGADVSNFLLSTNAQKAYFISGYRGLTQEELRKLFEIKDLRLEFVKSYKNKKNRNGYASASLLDCASDIQAAIAIELSALGVDLSKVEVDSEDGYPRIKFQWAYNGTKEQTYSITFIDADITSPDQYPSLLNKVLKNGIDLYYQRAGKDIPRFHSRFIPPLYGRMNHGGYFVTDDIPWTGDYSQPINQLDRADTVFPSEPSVIEIPNQKKLEEDILNILLLAKKAQLTGYGWKVKIRQKITSSHFGQDSSVLCLTPDSLTALADGSQKPTIELKEGEKALSLNKETPLLESHRVLQILERPQLPDANANQIEELIAKIERTEDVFKRYRLAKELTRALFVNPELKLTPKQVEVLIKAIEETKDLGAGYLLPESLGQASANNPELKLTPKQVEVLITAIQKTKDALARNSIVKALDQALVNNPSLKLTEELFNSIFNLITRTPIDDITNYFIQELAVEMPEVFWERLVQIEDKDTKREIFNRIIEPLFFKRPDLFTDNRLKTIGSVYAKDVSEFKYLLFYASLRETGPPAYDPALFPHQVTFRQLMATGKKRVLVMHNIRDGQGDELIRTSTLIHALLDLNPELEVVIYTNRGYLYGRGKDGQGTIISSHPRVEVRDIHSYDLKDKEQFNMIIHYYSSIDQVENSFRDYLSRKNYENDSASIYVKTNKAGDKFIYEKVVLAGKSLASISYGNNVYVPVYRLLAELGLPFRCGIQKPGESIFTHLSYLPADEYWEKVVLPSNPEHRPVVIVNGFGGEHMNKGYANNEAMHDNFAQAISNIVTHGYFVIILPNDQLWGTKEIAQNVVDKLLSDEKKYVLIAPLPQEDPFLHKYLLDKADIVVTVEGGLMHLAYDMGKPFWVLPMPELGRLERWFPVGANYWQGGIGLRDIGGNIRKLFPTNILQPTKVTGRSGGVDLNPQNLNIEVTGEAKGAHPPSFNPIPFDIQSFQRVKGQGIGEENKAGSLPGEKEKIAPSTSGKKNNVHNSSTIKKRFHIQFLLFMLAQAAAETMSYGDTKSHALAFLAQSLAKAGGPADKVDKIVKCALDAAKTITDRDLKSHALDFIAQVLAETGRLDGALDVAETIFDVSSSKSRALASKAKVLAKAGRLDEARNTVKTITDEYYKSVAIYFIDEVSGEPGRLGRARRPYMRDTDISFDSESRAFVVMAQDMEAAGRLDEAIAKEAESEINSTLDDLKSLTRLGQDKLAKPLFILLHNGFLLDEIKEEKFWQGLVGFIRQSGANITNNSTVLEEINKGNVEELFNLLSDYFIGFEISLYLPELFDKFRQSQKQERRDLLGNFKDYYASFVKGREPEKGLLDSVLIEEIHFSVIGSTKLTQKTYHSTLKRFASQEIPPPNFTTPFTLSTASGKLILSDTTEKEEKFIRERLAFLKDISQRALPEVITELLTTFHHVYLKPDSGALADNIRKLVQKLKKDASVERELSSQKVDWEALKKAILIYLQRQKKVNYSVILKEMTDQLTSRPHGRPTPKQIKTYLDKMISISLALQPRLKDKLDSISLENPLTPEILFAIADVLSEIKPEAEAQVKTLIDEVSGKKRLAEIISKRVKTVEGEGLIELEFIPAKNSLDLFFGFFGEDCTAKNPEELFNPAFTPIRIVRAGKIVGSIYTLTLKIKSKKSLVIVGIEPETPLANKLNAERFVEDLLNKLIEVAAQNGYTQLLVSTGEGVSSNRENIKGAMKKLSQNKPTIRQSVQPTFPEQSNYSIKNLALWKEISASSSAVNKDDFNLGLCLTPDSLITLADGTAKPLIALKPSSHRVGVIGEEEGDMVLSLNEQTGKLEPHRVNALLDMGVKPVYRITTAGGKTLKTTLTHPYLTKNGWRKLKDIKVGDEIAIIKEAINYQPATINYGAGEEAAAAKEDLSSAVGILSGVNSINHNASALKIKTDAILSNPESMSGRRKINQWLSKRERIVSRDVEANLFNDAFLQLGGKFSEFSFAGRGKLNFLNHQRLQANPNVCLIFSKGTNPNFLASSIPFLSFNTNLGLMGRWTSMASISQPTGLWNTYSLAETCSSSLASKAQRRSHNEYVSKIKYFGEPFLFTITAALKSEALKPASISSFGIEANFPSFSILTGSFADSFVNDADFIFTPPSNFKYNTLISGLSRLFSISEADASQVKEVPSNSDIFWDKIISIDYLGSLPVYDIEVEGTHNFIAQGIVAHNTYSNKEDPDKTEISQIGKHSQVASIDIQKNTINIEDNQGKIHTLPIAYQENKGGAITVGGRSLTVEEEKVINTAIRQDFEQEKARALSAQELANLNPEEVVKASKITVYKMPGLTQFDDLLVAHPGRGGDAFKHQKRHIYLSPAKLLFIQSLSPEARQQFWAHEVGHIDLANETRGWATEAQVKLRYPIERVLSEIQASPGTMETELLTFPIPQAQIPVNEKDIHSIEELIQQSASKGGVNQEHDSVLQNRLKSEKILPFRNNLKIMTVDRGDALGFPRGGTAPSPAARDLIYVYAQYNRLYNTYTMYVTTAFYNSYINRDSKLYAEILEYLYSRFVLKSPEPNSKASLFYKVVLDLIAKEGDLSTLEAFVEDTTQSQELIAYAYHLLRIKPVMQATVGVIVRGEGNEGYGVGFVVGEDEKYWYLLTNNHVVEFAPWNQQGKNSHGIFFPADDNNVAGIEIPVHLIVATSKGDDLALLEIEKSMIPRSISLSTVQFARRSPETMRVKSITPEKGIREPDKLFVVTLINPYGYDWTSGNFLYARPGVRMRRTVFPDSDRPELVLDKELWPGASGSCIIDIHGRVIGIFSSAEGPYIPVWTQAQKGGIIFLEQIRTFLEANRVPGVREVLTQDKKDEEQAKKEDARISREFAVFMDRLLEQVKEYDPVIAELAQTEGYIAKALKTMREQNQKMVIVVGKQTLESVDFLATVWGIKRQESSVFFAGVLAGPISPQLRSFADELLDAWVEVDAANYTETGGVKVSGEIKRQLNKLLQSTNQSEFKAFTRKNTVLVPSNAEGETSLYETREEKLLKLFMQGEYGEPLPLVVVGQPYRSKSDKEVAHYANAITAAILAQQPTLSITTPPAQFANAKKMANGLSTNQVGVVPTLPIKELADLEVEFRTRLKTQPFHEIITLSAENPSPADFLRDIVDTEQLSRNMVEDMLSYVFSNKRLVLAFDDNLTGLKRQKVRQIIQAVEAWKEAAANKSDAMRRLLTNNLTILQYSSLDELREKLGPDLNDNERNIIFAFTARIEDDVHSPANMGRAVRAVLMEGEEKFTEEDYYPLVEVVTLALAKELSGWDRYALLSNLAKLNIDYRRLGISDIDEDNRGIIIFRLLPVMERYDSNERVDRYTRLLQFLRSA